ncbi:MAG: hypothetical protein R6U57_11230 [Anaerolineales bacterium]
MCTPESPPRLKLPEIAQTWWPLAASWLLMALELPAISAVMARLANPKINLAAYGGIVYPMALIIEAPIIMLLAASTALSKDWVSYKKIRRFMTLSGGILTALHALVAFTPLYTFITEQIIRAPPEIIQPARTGLMIMLPWTWTIAYRRFNQGVLIRFGHSRTVGLGTVIRLSANGLVLSIGYVLKDVSGIVVATSAVAAGVISEAVYVGFRVQPVINNQLKPAPSATKELTRQAFIRFYFPLALTSLMTLLSQSLISAALSRMPRALDSLAIWPVISGLLFIFRSPGVAFNEVVVALLDKPRSSHSLIRFTALLVISSTALLVLIAITPLSEWWFRYVSSLDPDLTRLAETALLFGLLVPGANTLQSWYQGAMLQSHNTRGIPEAVVVYLSVSLFVYGLGIYWYRSPGIIMGTAGFSLGMCCQAGWLWYRSRPARQSINKRDEINQ